MDSPMSALEFRQTRTMLGYTQAHIAQLLGVTRRTVVAYENADRPVPVKIGFRIRHMLAKGQAEENKAPAILLNVKAWLKSPASPTAQLIEACHGPIIFDGIRIERRDYPAPLHFYNLFVPVVGLHNDLNAWTVTAPSSASVTIAGALITKLEVQTIDRKPEPEKPA